MKKHTKVILLVLTVSLIGLTGCMFQSTEEKAAIATEQKQKMDEEKKLKAEERELKAEEERIAEEKEIAEEKKREEPRPIYVNIIDPNTKGIVKTFNTKDLGFGKDNEKYKAELAKLTRELARGTKTTAGYDKRMILDKLDANGQVIQGTPQIILDETEMSEKIIRASGTGGDVVIPLYVTASGYKLEDVANLGEVVVASYTTHFNSGVAGRTKNIELSAQAINNIIIGTEDYFSFNTTVGPSDEAHGYQRAPEINDGKLVEGFGGGICQTSSTLYNAIDQIGVSYVEKHHHSLTVGYVPTGRDATVSYGGKDFRFKNTAGVPVIVKTIVGKGSLTIELRTSNAYKELLKKPV
jgi:vancomycin resistance protein YoaR